VAKDRPGLVVFDSYVAPDGLLRPGKGAPETWQPKDQVGFHALLVEGWNLLREGPLTVESYVETVREGIRLLERGAPTTEQERQDVRGWVVVARNHLDRNSDDMYKPKVRHFLKRFSEFVHTAKKRAGVLPVTLETIPGGGKPSLPPSGPVKLVGAPDVEPGDTAKSETGWNPFA